MGQSALPLVPVELDEPAVVVVDVELVPDVEADATVVDEVELAVVLVPLDEPDALLLLEPPVELVALEVDELAPLADDACVPVVPLAPLELDEPELLLPQATSAAAAKRISRSTIPPS